MSSDILPENSILLSDYVKPNRPMSQNEMKDLLLQFMKENKISNETVFHTKSKYTYHVKKFGKKEKEIIEKRNNDEENYNHNIGNCSVTWKLLKTPKRLRAQARDVIKEYMELHSGEHAKRMTHYKLELSKVFYTWLYNEQFVTENKSN